MKCAYYEIDVFCIDDFMINDKNTISCGVQVDARLYFVVKH